MFSSFLLEVAAKSTILLALAGIATLALRKKPAALRCHVWMFVLWGLALLPMAIDCLPGWKLPVRYSPIAEAFAFRTDMRDSGAATKAAGSPAVEVKTKKTGGGMNVVAIVWSLGMIAMFGQMVAGLVAMERRRREAKLVELSEFGPLARGMGIAKDVELRETANGGMPITFGLRKTTIFVPADLLVGDRERLRAVLLHELGHVKRRDVTTQLQLRAILAFYWWHPLAWLAWRELLKERELATDDLVLAQGGNASDYASHLLAVARSVAENGGAYRWAAGIPMARVSQLETRLRAILDATRDRQPLRKETVVIALLASGLAVTSLAGIEARDAKSSLTEQTAVRPAASEDSDLLARGKAALLQQRNDEAFDLFGQAAQADSSVAAEAGMWQGVIEERRKHDASAVEFYERARGAAPADSAQAATIMDLESRVLRRLNRNDEAEKLSAQIKGIRETLGRKATSDYQATLALSDSTPIASRPDGHAPILISKTEPEYSKLAAAAKLQGEVLLSIVVDTDGVPRNVAVIRGLGLGLDEKAVEAVKKWRFRPATIAEKAVAIQAQVSVNFQLL